MKKFISLLCVLSLCPLLVGCGDEEEKTKKNKENEETRFKVVTKDNLVYRNSSFEITEQGTTVITEVENTDDVAREVTLITLDLKDKDGNVIDTLTSYIGQKIEPGDSVATIASTGIDLSNTVSIEYGAQ